MVKEETTNNRPSTSLSLYFDHPTNPKNHKPNLEGIFECKTCNKQFSSFQALGGHRTSHNRRTIRAPGLDAKTKNRAHECPVCGMEFSIGQALGGHMRRHRSTISSTIPSPAEFELLDLSCPSRGNMHLLDLFPDH